MARETLLISKGMILSWAKRLADKPDDHAICPECETIYDGRYEACKCKEFG